MLKTDQVLLAVSSALKGISAGLVLADLFPLTTEDVEIVDEQVVFRVGPEVTLTFAEVLLSSSLAQRRG